MTSHRNQHERSAIKALVNLTNPELNLSSHRRTAQCEQIVRQLVNAAIVEIRKEIKQERTETVINAAIFDIEGDDTPAEIVAKQLEEEGARLPHPPRYETRGE